MSETTGLGPTTEELRWTGVTLAAQRFSATLGQALQQAVALERFHLAAEALGADRDDADAALREVQGPWTATSPNAADLSAAIQRLAEAR